MNRSYLITTAIRQLESKRKRFLIWGAIVAGISLFGILTGLFEPNSELREHVGTYSVLLLLGIFLLYKFVDYKNRIKAAKQYDAVFMNDSDGFISIDELSRKLGKDEARIRKELDSFFQRDLFHSSTLSLHESPGVTLANAGQNDKFVVIQCPSCSAKSRVRSGSHAVCPYCKSVLDTYQP